jgi:pyruvate formate lyase activating enzyme
MINLGGIEPLSLVDYPGLPAMVVFFRGCPFRCEHCHNAELQTGCTPSTLAPVTEAMSDMVDAVVISGGEPLLQPKAIKDIATIAKDSGFLVSVQTTGMDPNLMWSLRPYVDMWQVDTKPILTYNTLQEMQLHMLQEMQLPIYWSCAEGHEQPGISYDRIYPLGNMTNTIKY